MKAKGYFVACERNGQIMDFADIGNSASDFIRDDLIDQQVVFSTTNGTKTINMARDAKEILIGAFVNVEALAEYLGSKKDNVVIFCAAWKSLFNLEDSVFAGALAERLMEQGYVTQCDSVHGAIDLWHRARTDLKGYLSKSSHRNRLKHLVSDEDFDYTVKLNSTEVIPVLVGDSLQLLKQ